MQCTLRPVARPVIAARPLLLLAVAAGERSDDRLDAPLAELAVCARQLSRSTLSRTERIEIVAIGLGLRERLFGRIEEHRQVQRRGPDDAGRSAGRRAAADAQVRLEAARASAGNERSPDRASRLQLGQCQLAGPVRLIVRVDLEGDCAHVRSRAP